MRRSCIFRLALVSLAGMLSLNAMADDTPEGVVRSAGKRWPFKDGDRLYWFGASHTSIGVYCSAVEFYIKTRFPDIKLVSAHTSKPTGLNPWGLKKPLEERKPTIVFPEGGFYDTGDPQKFVGLAAAVNAACTNAGAKCIFMPTVWLAETTNKLNPAFLEKDANFKEVEKRLREEKKLTAGTMMVPAVIEGSYYRCEKGLSQDKTMAALKEWGDANGVLVLESYNDQAVWAKAQWAKNPGFVQQAGTTPHLTQAGYMAMGIFAIERLEAPILESRLEIEVAGDKAESKKNVNCEVADMAVEKGGVTFKRLDKVLPVVPPVACWDLPGEPTPLLKLSPYFLTVRGLAAGSYSVSVEGALLGKASAEELAAGVNLNEIYVKSGSQRPLKAPWHALWEACRGSTMDKEFVPGDNARIGKSAWKWEIKPAK